MSLELERANVAVESAKLHALLERDGAVIVEDIMSADQLQRLNAELDLHIEGLSPGLRHPSHEAMVEFYGHKTIRYDGLPGKSATFLEIMLLPQLIETADCCLIARTIYSTPGSSFRSGPVKPINLCTETKTPGASYPPQNQRWRLKRCLP